MLTNTSLMLLRLCGKYTHLMKDLKPIASDVFHAMTQLLDFYVIVVYNFFTKDLVCINRYNFANYITQLKSLAPFVDC